MVQTVVHANRRGCKYVYVKDDGPNFGYSGRVAYAMGLDKPNYPVPSTLGIVEYPEEHLLCIKHSHSPVWVFVYDQESAWRIV